MKKCAFERFYLKMILLSSCFCDEKNANVENSECHLFFYANFHTVVSPTFFNAIPLMSFCCFSSSSLYASKNFSESSSLLGFAITLDAITTSVPKKATTVKVLTINFKSCMLSRLFWMKIEKSSMIASTSFSNFKQSFRAESSRNFEKFDRFPFSDFHTPTPR